MSSLITIIYASAVEGVVYCHLLLLKLESRHTYHIDTTSSKTIVRLLNTLYISKSK